MLWFQIRFLEVDCNQGIKRRLGAVQKARFRRVVQTTFKQQILNPLALLGTGDPPGVRHVRKLQLGEADEGIRSISTFFWAACLLPTR